jgi:hypothetical protein
VVVALGLTTAEPEVPDPIKLPLLQDVALVELQERVDDCPAFIDAGLAASETVGVGGGGGAATVTVTFAVADPAFPAQVIEYPVVVPGVTTAEPAIPAKVKLLLVQEVALVELQESVDDCPAFTDVGLAESETLGGDGGTREVACRWMPVRAVLTNRR